MRLDREGRDVTDLPGLWSESDCESDCEMVTMSIFKPDPFDFICQLISLQFAIKEFRNELKIDVCEHSPRLVVMAVSDLERRVDEIVAAMQAKMEENRKQELNEPSNEID